MSSVTDESGIDARMDEKALIEWFVFGRMENFNDANSEQGEKEVPLIDMTVDEESSFPAIAGIG